MVNFFRGWFPPAHPSAGYQHQGNSVFSDTIVTVGLSALAFFAANLFDHDAPGLAALLRCVPVGAALIWLFKRCLPNGNGYQHHYHAAPVVHAYAPPPSQHYHSNRRNWLNWSNWLQPNAMHPAPIHRHSAPPPQHYAGHFPPVHPAPAQPNGFPPVHPAPAQSHGFPYVHPAPAQPHGFPPVQRAPAGTGGSTHLHPAPASRNGFPQVQRAPAQPGNFRPVHPAPTHASSHPIHSTPFNHSGNQRQMFTAAERR
jgi:hypothetical protein